MDKKVSRLRRAQRARHKIQELRTNRLTVYRSNRHIYAQILAPGGGRVLASASTLEPEVRQELSNGSTKDAAALIGRRIAERAKSAGIETVAFDRAGFRFHGRVKALAEAAREAGLRF